MKAFDITRSLNLTGVAWLLVTSQLAWTDAGPSIRYRLVHGSTFAEDLSVPTAPSRLRMAPVHGTFKLTRQVSPLDWEVYALTDLELAVPQLPAGGATLAGSGSYKSGGRGAFTQTLEFKGSLDGQAVAFDSGAVAIKSSWPVIEIDVPGIRTDHSAEPRYSIHLVAVPELRRWHYQLLGPSQLLDDCPPCDRLSIPVPLRGAFDLILFDENPLTSRYAVSEMNLWVGDPTAPAYRVAGGGFFEIGGEVALRQALTLESDVSELSETIKRAFTNDSPVVERPWPLLQVDLTDTAGDPVQVYHLHILAAPFREMWFSTVHSLTSGRGWPISRISAGDVLSDRGSVIKANTDLMARMGLMPVVGDHPIDAVHSASPGEVWFSLNEGAHSESLGPLQAGDLLSDQGRIVRKNQELTARFGLMPPVPDLGLDAVQVMEDGETLFSITGEAFSEQSGLRLQRGDLLSDRGKVRKSSKELMALFHPEEPGQEVGLDAVHVWPHGETWFSVEDPFNDKVLGPIMDGDLLSDQGYVVFRNLELVGPFMPLEDLANFGLDALHVFVDAGVVVVAPRMATVTRDSQTGSVTLTWEGMGPNFQVERGLDVAGPFEPVSAPLTERSWTDPALPAGQAQAFYRVKQW